MKILMVIATGAIITFPMDKSVEADCFEQGHRILQNISTYQGSGTDQGWYLKGKPIQVAGWYCEY
jgi:hypothetical protein|tara:strand:+ start:185 stop:379 length:195 start_codon:yes stop_codon:yes gene_type:complete